MPETITITNPLWKVKSTKSWLGETVPWEVDGYQEDFVAAETVGGFFDLSSWATIEITGKDAKDFLQRMSTVNFKTFDAEKAAHGAFLTGKATVVSLGMFLQDKETYRFLVTPNQRQSTLEHLEKFHFGEELQIRDASDEFALVAWWNPRGDLLQDFHLDRSWPPLHIEWRRWKSLNLFVWHDDRREDLFWIFLSRKEIQPFFFEMHRLHANLLGLHLFELFRIGSGVPEVGVDVSDKEIILETAFEEAVARNKGCYPGQEVVERIFTYGSVNKKLLVVDLKLAKSGIPKLPVAWQSGGKECGILVSAETNPKEPGNGVGLAYIHKFAWDSQETFEVQGLKIKIRGESK